MVLDYLVSTQQARQNPSVLTIAAMVFVSFGVLIEIFLPVIRGSIIIFTMVASIPLIWSLLVREEIDEEKNFDEAEKMWREAFKQTGPIRRIIASHEDLIRILAFFFIGAVIAYAAWFAILPTLEHANYVPAGTAARIFSDQAKELDLIKSTVSNISGKVAINDRQFVFLFTHNLQVLALMFIFCIVYGVGSVYLLLWNASIIGVVIGSKIAEGIAQAPELASQITSAFPFAGTLPIEVLTIISAIIGGLLKGLLSLFGLLPHGVFELGAYFIATIAGGLLSVSIMRGIQKPEVKYVLADTIILTGISLLLLLIGAVIEASY